MIYLFYYTWYTITESIKSTTDQVRVLTWLHYFPWVFVFFFFQENVNENFKTKRTTTTFNQASVRKNNYSKSHSHQLQVYWPESSKPFWKWPKENEWVYCLKIIFLNLDKNRWSYRCHVLCYFLLANFNKNQVKSYFLLVSIELWDSWKFGRM